MFHGLAAYLGLCAGAALVLHLIFRQYASTCLFGSIFVAFGESRPRNVGRGFQKQPRLGARRRPYGIDPGSAGLPDRGNSVLDPPPTARRRNAREPKQTRLITIRLPRENQKTYVYEFAQSFALGRGRYINHFRSIKNT